jgi:hypothetical protein
MLVELMHLAAGASGSVGCRAVHAVVTGWRDLVETCVRNRMHVRLRGGGGELGNLNLNLWLH